MTDVTASGRLHIESLPTVIQPRGETVVLLLHKPFAELRLEGGTRALVTSNPGG